MQIEQLLPLDEAAAAVDAGRRSLGRLDLSSIPSALGDISSSTMAAARDTIPGPWSRPKNRWRWPLVGVLLVLGTAALGLTFLGPMLRRRITGRPAAPEPSIDYTTTYSTEPRPDETSNGSSDASATSLLEGSAYVVES